nr:MAG TPA: hypothetical protein [Inoviridae sp.]
MSISMVSPPLNLRGFLSSPTLRVYYTTMVPIYYCE